MLFVNFFKKFSENLRKKSNEKSLADNTEEYFDDNYEAEFDDLVERRERLQIKGMKTNLTIFQWLEEKFKDEIPESCIEAYEEESINLLPKSIQKGYIKDLVLPIPLPLAGKKLLTIANKYAKLAKKETEAKQKALDDGLEDPETVDVTLGFLYLSVGESIFRSTKFYPDFDYLSKKIIEELKEEESQKSWTKSMAKYGFFGNWDEVYNLLSPTGLMNAYTWMCSIEIEAEGEEIVFGELFKANTPNWKVYIPVTIFSRYNSDDAIGEVLNDYEIVNEIKKLAGISFSYNHDGLPAEEIIDPEDSEEEGCVYLIRNKDIYKIGISENALRRFGQLKPDEVINVVKCSNYRSLEKELHKKFKEFRIPQTEYFRFNKKQVKEVNNAMTKGADF